MWDRATLGLVERIGKELRDAGRPIPRWSTVRFHVRRESVVGALAFAEPRPNQQREPGNGNSQARSDSDQPHHVQAADVLELWTPENIKCREASEQCENLRGFGGLCKTEGSVRDTGETIQVPDSRCKADLPRQAPSLT